MFFNENKLLPFSGYLDPATAIVGTAIVSGAMGERASSRAARTQEKASKRSIEEQRRQFDIMQEQSAPYRAAGKKALLSLSDMMGMETENPYEPGTPEYAAFNSRKKYDFQESPGYQFRLGEGTKALERSQAGRRLGGRAAKEAVRYGQGAASQEYGQQFGRLATIAGFGPPMVGAGLPTGIPGTIEAGGVAQAQAGLAGSAMANQALQSGLGNYMTYQAYNQQPGYGGYDPRLSTEAGTLYQ